MKRAMDLAAATTLLLVLAPVFLGVALLVRINLGRPVLFRQVRPGLSGRPFTIYKFRSMRDAVDSSGQPLPDAERLGRFGRWLRSWSLDEIPQLINIVRGELSLVGPRPLLMEYLPRYSARQAQRHLVKPGVTGLAQVSGRNAISWDERLELDAWYVDNQSLTLDIKILFLTVKRVLTRHGVSEQGQATVRPFEGSRTKGGSQ